MRMTSGKLLPSSTGLNPTAGSVCRTLNVPPRFGSAPRAARVASGETKTARDGGHRRAADRRFGVSSKIARAARADGCSCEIPHSGRRLGDRRTLGDAEDVTVIVKPVIVVIACPCGLDRPLDRAPLSRAVAAASPDHYIATTQHPKSTHAPRCALPASRMSQLGRRQRSDGRADRSAQCYRGRRTAPRVLLLRHRLVEPHLIGPALLARYGRDFVERRSACTSRESAADGGCRDHFTGMQVPAVSQPHRSEVAWTSGCSRRVIASTSRAPPRRSTSRRSRWWSLADEAGFQVAWFPSTT